jgi:large subunit ribosomal protein L43
MNIFIRHTLPNFAKQHPNIEITVSPRPNHHPLIRGHYVNGRTKEFCVRNLEQGQILNRVELMSQDDGKKLKRVKYPVTSTNENVRGIWSGLHDNKISIGLEGLLAESKRRKN